MISPVQTKNEFHSLLERMPSKECHCHRCGARIAEGDARCAACGKKQQVKNTNLLDFLIAHTKDEITGKITDSIYEAVKNFLLSHLFGVVVSLSLVAAVGVTVYASEPYIDRVSGAQRPTLSAEQEMLLYELNIVAQELGYADAEEMLREQGDWETYEELFGKAGHKPNVQESAYAYMNEHNQVIAALSEYIQLTCQNPNTEILFDGESLPVDAVREARHYPSPPDLAVRFDFNRSFAPENDMTIVYDNTRFDRTQLTREAVIRLADAGMLAGETDAHLTYTDPAGNVTRQLDFTFMTVRDSDGSWYIVGSEQLITGQPNGSTYADGTSVPPADILDIREAIDFYYFYAREDFLDELTQMRLTNYNGEHQMSKGSFRIQLNDGETYIPDSYLVQNLVFQPEQMTSETSKALADRGYTVAECIIVLLYDVPLSVLEQEKTDPEQCYTMTLVKTGGEPFKWSVAEDVLLYAMP